MHNRSLHFLQLLWIFSNTFITEIKFLKEGGKKEKKNKPSICFSESDLERSKTILSHSKSAIP